jgi:hypothetical protein
MVAEAGDIDFRDAASGIAEDAVVALRDDPVELGARLVVVPEPARGDVGEALVERPGRLVGALPEPV